jgi:predicted ferric reductase
MGRSGAFRWILAYAALVLLPLFIALARPLPPGRGFWIEFGVGLGFVGLAMLWLQFALTARFRNIAASLGIDTMLQFHGRAGLFAILLALAHPVVLLAANPGFIAFLDPRVSAARALALYALTGALLLLALLTLQRRPLRIPYEWWRLTHGVLGFGVVFIGTVHVIRVGHYISVPWKQALWIALGLGAVALLVHTRLLRPLQLRKRPYAVTKVRQHRGDASTLTIEPEGHHGLTFEAGQFAWLTIGRSPFSLQQHPFSFSSSSSDPRQLQMTIKSLGDFTSTIGTVQPGTRAFLEGPYGAFTLDRNAPRAVFIAGGVGISPILSMLRTAGDSSDQRPFMLIYATSKPERTLFMEELEALRQQLDLDVVHVFEEPQPDWKGERGLLTPEILQRHLPPADTDYQALVCGPPPMMDVAERTLRGRGVPLRQIRSERFDIV